MDLHQWLRMMTNERMELDSMKKRFLQEPYTNKLGTKSSSTTMTWRLKQVRAKKLEEILMTARCSLSLRIISQETIKTF